MDWTHVVTAVLGGGGTGAILKYIEKRGSRRVAEKPVRNGERASIMQTLARFDEYFIDVISRLTGIEASQERLSSRVARLEDRVARLEGRERPT